MSRPLDRHPYTCTLVTVATSDRSAGLGSRVKARREVLGISQEYLARAIGVSKNTVTRWEHGSAPAAERALVLAKALGVSIEWLVTGESAPKRRGRRAA